MMILNLTKDASVPETIKQLQQASDMHQSVLVLIDNQPIGFFVPLTEGEKAKYGKELPGG